MIPDGIFAHGNQGTCEASAFALSFGGIGSELYTLSLCIYYLQVIRYNTSDRDFATRIEPWLHRISTAFPLLGSVVNLAVGNFNSNGFSCYISPQPFNCIDNPDVECIRGANAFVYFLIFGVMPLFVSFVGIVYIMVDCNQTREKECSFSVSANWRR